MSRLKSVDVLIKARSAQEAKTIEKFDQLPTSKTKVKIEEYSRLNQGKGMIYRYDFRTLSTEEILEGLKGQRVVDVYRQTKRKKGVTNQYEDSEVYILSFDDTILPQYVYAGY